MVHDSRICAICGKIPPRQRYTIRKKWIDEGGHGRIPDYAVVHIDCDKREQGKIKK